MSVSTKRRPIFRILSLPLVVALVFVLVAKLTALRRAEMVAELADQVAHQESAEASAALRQLAAMPRPPLDVLVATATSADPELADQAQVLINGLLRRWQRKLDANDGVAGVGRHLRTLSAALSQHQREFSAGDHRWLVATTQKILRMANQIPPQHTPLVAQQCDAVLAAVAANEARIATLIDRDLAAQPLVPADATTVHSTSNAQSTAAQPIVAQPAEQNIAPVETTTTAAKPAQAANSLRAPPVEPVAAGHAMSSTSAAPAGNADTELRPNRELMWTQPLLNVAPKSMFPQLMDDQSSQSTTSFHDSTVQPADNDDPARRPWSSTDSRELLHRWLLASDNDMAAMEEELIHRGFGRITDRLVERMFSENATDRLQLVDDVLGTPGIDARPWLALLAEDPDADVRLLTVTIMATSNDTTLLDKAWEVALHDLDPRIAGLAGRLRERRDAVKRR